jgi:hypothetical protein
MGIIDQNLTRVISKLPNLDLTAFAFEPVDTTDHAEPTGPTPLDEAESLGFRLTIDGQDPNPPRGWSLEECIAFFEGMFAAWKHQDRVAFDEDPAAILEWLDGPRLYKTEPHPAELGCEGRCSGGYPSFEE